MPTGQLPSRRRSAWNIDQPKRRLLAHKAYPHSFYIPAAIVYAVLFIVPTGMAFFFSLTRWSLFDWEFIGLENFVLFFNRPALVSSMRNTLIYAVVTSGLKVVLGLLLAVLFTSVIRLKTVMRSMVFFPVIVSIVAVGITFKILMHPSEGLINKTIELLGGVGPGMADRPPDRPALGGAGRCLERASASPW